MTKSDAKLYIVATPIGNLEDLSPRAINTLRQVDLIAAEDTRHSKKLLNTFSIHTPMIPLHDHNEARTAKDLIQKLCHGHSIALISDAGTPLISDPGYKLIHQAHQAGITLSPIPGPCAAITALSVSGLPCHRFLFVGFLPQRHQARCHELSQLKTTTATLIFYESRHRIIESLSDMVAILGGHRLAFMGRELTKQFETLYQAPLGQLLNFLEHTTDQQRGEFVIIVSGLDEAAIAPQTTIDSETLLKCLLEELPVKQAVKLACQITGDNKNTLYKLALTLKSP